LPHADPIGVALSLWIAGAIAVGVVIYWLIGRL
jgi:hypothetical protein